MMECTIKTLFLSLLLGMMLSYIVLILMVSKTLESKKNGILHKPNSSSYHGAESRFTLQSASNISKYDTNYSNMDLINRTIPSRILLDSTLSLSSAKTAKTIQKFPKANLWELDTTEEDVCSSPSVNIIAVVPSAVGNFKQRNRIRQSWASRDLFDRTKIRAVFVLGATTNETLQAYVNWEADRYKDVIQTTIIDSYRNLTYKSLSALSWIYKNCHGAKWVAKIDDDVVVNPFNLIDFLEQRENQNFPSEIIMGRLRTKAVAWRIGKWKVTEEEFPQKQYPPFLLGSAYVMGRTVVDKLLPQAKNTQFLWLEDVYVTGLLATAANISRMSIERARFVTKSKFLIYRGIGIFYIGATDEMFEYFWDKIIQHQEKNKEVSWLKKILAKHSYVKFDLAPR